jgi:hypothetical protein
MHAVIRHILLHQQVTRLRGDIDKECTFNAFCYAACERFSFQRQVAPGMCLLTGTVNDYNLQLACSVKFFCDITFEQDRNGELVPVPTSAMWGFFMNGEEYRFKTIFFITSVRDKTIYGSPLFLILAPFEGSAP